jgi:hypothetical protein
MPLMQHRYSPIIVQKNCFVHSLMCRYDFGEVHRSLLLVLDFPFEVLSLVLHATYFSTHMFVTSAEQSLSPILLLYMFLFFPFFGT